MDKENIQTDTEIITEFEELFSSTASEEDESESEDDTVTEENTEDTSEEEDEPSSTEESEDEDDDEDSSEESSKENPQVKKQAQAFYTLRKQNKANEELIKNLGSVLGFDSKTDSMEIVAKVQELITQKQAKEQNVPVEMLERMQELERKVQEKETNEQESKVTEDLTLLAEEFDLNQKALEEFLIQLAEAGRNPLEVENVDLKGEYLKLHFEELLEAERNAAISKEQERKDKVDEKSPGTLPGKTGGGDKSEEKIESVSDLDKFFDTVKD